MSDMQMTTIAPEVEKETAGPVCEATMTQQPVVQQPQVIVMGGQQYKTPPTCCVKTFCPVRAVRKHEGCGCSATLACFFGCIYTTLCWTPKQIPL
jgi:hypothetical protein